MISLIRMVYVRFRHPPQSNIQILHSGLSVAHVTKRVFTTRVSLRELSNREFPESFALLETRKKSSIN